jgi:nuclear pore complex protein Nup155
LAAGNTFLSFEASEPQAYSLSGAGALLGTGKDGRLSNLASQAFFERGGKPVWIDRAAFAGGDAQGQVVFSGRREGLALYMARVLRPIWNEKVTVTKYVLDVFYILFTECFAVLLDVKNHLYLIKHFSMSNEI